jgi:polyisoprenyl-phosphate glycosyltransferase
VSGAPPKLSIVVPCYNEEEVLSETASRLGSLLSHLVADERVSATSQIIFIDDGSGDETWRLIANLTTSEHFAGLKLSRNRGHQNALIAGLQYADGDIVISVDADLQDDLNAIPQMLDKAAIGADIVYGVRGDRTSDTWFKRASAEGYYRTLGLLGVEIVHNHADYRLLTRRALESMRAYDEVNLFLRGIIPQLGYKTAIVEYTRSERFAGESKYPLRKMLSLAFDGVTSFSARPLRSISVAGAIVSLISFLVGVWAIVTALAGHSLPGWASTVIPLYFMGGIQLLSLGVIGEYLGKTYMEVKRRPRFHVEEARNLGAAKRIV